jgi:hypothetical protein
MEMKKETCNENGNVNGNDDSENKSTNGQNETNVKKRTVTNCEIRQGMERERGMKG